MTSLHRCSSVLARLHRCPLPGPPDDQLEVSLPKPDPRQVPGRLAPRQLSALVVQQHKSLKLWRAPHQFERDPRRKLRVRHVDGGRAVAAVCAGAPRAAGAQLLERGLLDVGAQEVAFRNFRDRTVGVLVLLNLGPN